MSIAIVSHLASLGCTEWTGGSNRRVYVSDEVAATAIGLVVRYYDSGNVSGASLNGSKISNSEAREVLAAIRGCYYDCTTEKFVGSRHGVAAALRAQVSA